jgi:Holliday junction resolvase-like predicted endonuclease
VKTAGINSPLDPREYLTKNKLKRLEASTMLYLSEETPEIDPYYRIDFLAVSETREGMSIRHFKAVSAEQYE